MAQLRAAETVLVVISAVSQVASVANENRFSARALRVHLLEQEIEVKRQLCECLQNLGETGDRCETIAEDRQVAELLLPTPLAPQYLRVRTSGAVQPGVAKTI